MNTCERFENQLSAWLDNELERAEQVELVDHLVRCPACRDFTVRARSLDGLIATARPPRDRVAPSPELWQKIRRSTPTVVTGPPRSGSWWAAGLRAAAVVIFSVGLGVLFMNGAAPVEPGEQIAEIRLGEDPDGMDDTRFMALTTEVLRADPRYHAALYRVMEQVVRDSGEREASTEYFRPDDADRTGVPTEAVNRNPV